MSIVGEALAQEAFSLRGRVDDSQIASSLKKQPAVGNRVEKSASDDATDDVGAGYIPESQGALPEPATETNPVAVEPPRLSFDPGAFSGDGAQSPDTPETGDNGATPARNAAPETQKDEPETGGVVRTGSVEPADPVRNEAAGRQNLRTGAIQGADPASDDDPFAPLGIRAGTFVLFPSLEQGLRVTDNADGSPDGQGAVLSETTLRLNAISDWSRHSATINAYYTQVKSVSGEDYSEPRAGLDASLRLDLANEYAVTATAGYDLARESATAPVNFTGTASRPLRHEMRASLGVEKSAGKFLYRLTGGVERQQYGNAELSGGGTLSQEDRNSTLLFARLRTGYEISPALTPFVEGEFGRRIQDQTLDSSGFARSSNRYGLRAGATFDFGEKLNGEIAAGWLRETLDDPGLDAIGGLSAEAAVNWSPSRATMVALNASTEVEGTNTAGSSGSLLYAANATVTRQIRSRLSAFASLGGYYRDFSDSSGHDVSWQAGVGFTYWLNRNLGLVGTLDHEKVSSSDKAREYTSNSAYLGLRLQR